MPLPDLCALGGWKDAKTILQCYQAPDPDTMRSALANRRKSFRVNKMWLLQKQPSGHWLIKRQMWNVK